MNEYEAHFSDDIYDALLTFASVAFFQMGNPQTFSAENVLKDFCSLSL